jgi:hypothetical protein
MKSILIYLFLLLFLFSCNKNGDPIIEPIPDPEPDIEETDSIYAGFNIYFLKDENIVAQDLYNSNLTELELENRPFLTQGDIEFYDASVHTIQLYKQITIPDMVSVSGKPFVVVTDTIRHYFGAVWPMYSSGNFDGPIIDVAPRFYPLDIVKIALHNSYSGEDKRFNDTIQQVLSDYEVLHAGISCILDSIILLENDSINNKCRLNFTYTVKNNDELSLYVFDPLKMESGYFHYYHNGAYLRNDFKIYESTSGGKAPTEGTDELSMMTKLNCGESITRTIEKSGYPFIPNGKYECGFRFSSPYRIAKSKRIQPDGRVWIGTISTTDSVSIE